MKTSTNSVRALEIISILDEAAQSDNHFVHIETDCDVKNLRRNITLFSKDKKWRKRLVTSASDDGKVLFVKLKERSRIDVLEELLFKAMLSIENVALYEEIYATLYGGKDGQ